MKQYFLIILIIIILSIIIYELDIWIHLIYYGYNHNKVFIETNTNSKKVSIILTTTVNINNKIAHLKLTNVEKRKQIYIKTIKKWLTKTLFNIIVIENSGYDFIELTDEKEKYKNRFEVISFDPNKFQEANYLKNNSSKGAHEFFSIDYAIHNSKIIKKTNFVIKITGRYYIDNFEKYINSIENFFNYYGLRQYFNGYCVIVGSNISHLNYIFNKNIIINNDVVEYEWKDRMDKLDNKVLTCPLFKIEPVLQGGTKKTMYYL